MIVLNLGQAKSGSTFVFQVLTSLRNMSKSSVKPTFHPKITEEIVSQIRQDHVDGELVIVKSHSGLNEPILELLNNKDAVAIATFRDPRDSALALFDAGVRDRSRGEDTPFAKIVDSQDLVKKARSQLRNVSTLLETRHPRILGIPYFSLATDQNFVVRQICEHVGLANYADKVVRRWESEDFKKKIGQFNKGVANRFVEEFSVEDLRLIHSSLDIQSKYVDEKTRLLIANTNLAPLFENACRARDEAIERRLS